MSNRSEIAPVTQTARRGGKPALSRHRGNLVERLLISFTVLGMLASTHAQETVTLTLRVLDTDTGKPIPGYRARAETTRIASKSLPKPPTSEQTGNAEGIAVLEFPSVKSNLFTRILTIEHPDYVPQRISWANWSRSGNDVVFPLEHTAKLERGVSIGGVVKDEDGKPLAGVSVHLFGSAIPQGVQTSPDWSLSMYSTNDSPKVFTETDAQGRWRYLHFPKSYPGRFRIGVQRPGGAYWEFETAAPEYEYGPPVKIAPLADLLGEKSELVLPSGHRVYGIVLDQGGRPIGGASLSESQGRNAEVVWRLSTGADGRFVLPDRPAKELTLEVHAPGFAAALTNVFPAPEIPELKLQLQPKRPLLARVVDENGAPYEGVTFLHYQPGRYMQLSDEGTTTDALGRFHWDDAPSGPQKYYLRSTNNTSRRMTMDSSEPEYVITLRRAPAEFIRLTGTVLAADTRAPVPKFTIGSADASPGNTFNFNAAGADGRLDAKLLRTAWRENFERVARLQIQAPGYEPFLLDEVDFEAGDRDFKIELKKGGELAGVVLEPGGKPAKGARLELSRSYNTYLNRPGEMQQSGQGSLRATTAADGRFTFPSDLRNRHIVVTHESGFAAVAPQDVLARGKINLERWGTLTGVVMEAGKPVPGVRLGLNSVSRSMSWKPGDPPPKRSEMFGILYSAASDEHGRFMFEKVPAGEFTLNRRFNTRQMGPIYFSHPQLVTARSGETVEVTYGGKGRTVTGWAQTDPPGLAVDWQWDRQALVLQVAGQVSEPNFFDFANPASYTAARQAYDAAIRTGAKRTEPAQYQLEFEPDGHFRVADVPAGNYQLTLRLTEPQAGRQMSFSRQKKELGSADFKVSVPDGRQDLPADLGNFPVKITGGNLPAAPTLPPFEAMTLDGKTLRMADFRGKHVALVFWAAWCRSTADALEDLQASYNTFKDNPRFAMVGVSLDESTAVAKTFAGLHQLKWASGWLDDAGRARLVDVYGVKGTPTVFLLDPDGGIAARDVRPGGLQALLKQKLSQP